VHCTANTPLGFRGPHILSRVSVLHAGSRGSFHPLLPSLVDRAAAPQPQVSTRLRFRAQRPGHVVQRVPLWWKPAPAEKVSLGQPADKRRMGVCRKANLHPIKTINA
jgi:hypothetical protein